MAPPDRPGTAVEALAARLGRDAHGWSFFQLVRALTRSAPGAPEPGGEGPARAENVRFRPALSLGFAPSGIAGVERLPSENGAPSPRWRVTVNFMGIYGPSSPLPNHVTEDFLDSTHEPDPARDFVDLFHHRIVSLFHRAWGKYRYPLQYTEGGRDPASRRWMCLMGLGTPGLEAAAGLSAARLLATAGLLADGHRSAAGLECFLRAQLGIPELRVRTNVRRFARIPDGQRMRLGGGSARLGRTAVLGERMLDRSGAFQIEIGPLGIAEYRRFLPGGADLTRLVRLTRLYARDPLDFSVLLRLNAAEVPPLGLRPSSSLPLGWASWVAPHGAADGVARIPIHSLDPRRAAPRSPRAHDPGAPVSTETPAVPSAPRPAATRRPAPRVTTIRRT